MGGFNASTIISDIIYKKYERMGNIAMSSYIKVFGRTSNSALITSGIAIDAISSSCGIAALTDVRHEFLYSTVNPPELFDARLSQKDKKY